MSGSDLLRGDSACCDAEAEGVDFKGPSLQGPAAIFAPRSLPPFILSHDLTRGGLFALQALLHYILPSFMTQSKAMTIQPTQKGLEEHRCSQV